jgi:hypothetical protein
MADLVGQTLGNYRIESVLGAGGMGEVYRATHTRLGRAAAIKVMHANQAADPTFQARFLREARAAAALSHPNIVEVFDFGEQDGASYLVMELVPDGSLRTLLKQRASGQGWSLGLGVDLVRQAAEGLAYAHARGMVHRDIKPDNLLLQRLDAAKDDSERDDDIERYRLKISDFGLARLVDDGGELTQSGMVMGTPTYMSPEQCQGGALDGRSDLYSLGVVLYEVATGTPPFRVKSLSEAVFKHISATPTAPREIRPDLPPTLEDVIMRCLAKRPEDRFATGTELADALEGALGDTELRTIITTRDSAAAGTPTPAALADPAAPTVAASDPVGRVSTPGGRARSAAATGEEVASDDETIRASRSPTPAPRPAAVRAGTGASDAMKAQPKWPGPDAKTADTPAGKGVAQALLARPQALGIGIIAVLALVAVLVVMLTPGLHPGAGSTVKRATPTATIAAPTATPVEPVIYHDSLAASTNKWENDTHAFYSSGGYEIVGAWFTFSPVSHLGDGTISVRMKQLGGPADQFYGIMFRSANDSLYYVFGISQNQKWTFSLVSSGNGNPIVPPTADSHIAGGLNASNTITVRVKSGHFIFYINGAQVGQADNSAIASGRVGLINTVGNLNVVYNDFTVSGPKS